MVKSKNLCLHTFNIFSAICVHWCTKSEFFFHARQQLRCSMHTPRDRNKYLERGSKSIQRIRKVRKIKERWETIPRRKMVRISMRRRKEKKRYFHRKRFCPAIADYCSTVDVFINHKRIWKMNETDIWGRRERIRQLNKRE